MNNIWIKRSLVAGVLILTLAGCNVAESAGNDDRTIEETQIENSTIMDNIDQDMVEDDQVLSEQESAEQVVTGSVTSASYLNTSEMFTTRDLEQSPDLTEAITITLVSGEDVLIHEAGTYVFSGEVSDTSIIVDADEEAKVQLVLDGVQMTNEATPAIYVISGDKVFVTTTDSDNVMSVTSAFMTDSDINLDGVIYSKSDLVMNGLGTLEINATTGNGITSKDDLKITGGTYSITAMQDAIEANDSIRIYDGDITIVANKDGLHSENEEDLSLGYIYIQNGTFNFNVVDDAIRGNSTVQIDGGDINIETCAEGIEGTSIQINGGVITIYASDDGINAAEKSEEEIMIEVNGGNIHVVMASGDTDGFDANGNIVINGGIISVDGGSTFDADGTIDYNGGEVTLNGEVVTEIIQSQMGGRGKGGK